MILTKPDLEELLGKVHFKPDGTTEPARPIVTDEVDMSIQLQPNGIDLTVKAVRKFFACGVIGFNDKELPPTVPIEWDDNGSICLPEGSYLVELNETLDIPLNLVGTAIPRSTVLRTGNTVATALFDGGYVGKPSVLLVVLNSHGLTLKRNARIVQLSFHLTTEGLEDGEGYDGSYQHEGMAQG